MSLTALWLSSFAVPGPSHVAMIDAEIAFVPDLALVPDMSIHGGALFACVKIDPLTQPAGQTTPPVCFN
jgi:hypothetical protein